MNLCSLLIRGNYEFCSYTINVGVLDTYRASLLPGHRHVNPFLQDYFRILHSIFDICNPFLVLCPLCVVLIRNSTPVFTAFDMKKIVASIVIRQP